MKFKTLLSLALALCVTVGALFTTGCPDRKKADRFIAAVEAAQFLPGAFGVTGDQAQLVSDGFGAVAAAARAFRDGRGTWDALVATFREVKARPSWQRLDPDLRAQVDAVWTVSERLLNSIQPAGTAAEEGGPLPEPDFSHVDEADLRELERLVGRRK